YGLGLPLMVTGIAGMAVMLRAQPRIGALLLSFPLAYFVVAGSMRNLFFRYAIPLVPFFCLAAAYIITRYVKSDAVAAVIALGLVLPPAVSTVRFDRLISQVDNRVVVARWFDANVPAGDTVLLSGTSYGYVQFTRDRYRAWLWD